MLGSLFQRKKQTLRKDKTKMKDRRKTTKNLSTKGLMDKKQRKNGILKGKTKGKQGKKTEKEEKRHFKTGLLGEQNRQKTSKITKNSLVGPFTKQKHKNTGNKKTQPPKTKNRPQKHFFAFWQTAPYFGKFLIFFKLHFSCLQSCVLLKAL